MSFSRRSILFYLGLLSIITTVLAAGCGARQAAPGQMAAEVKAMQVIQRDTPVTYEFVGQIEAKNEVQIRAKVSGNIIARMVEGGTTVQAGQTLFQIDRRQYESTVLSARAQLSQSEAVLSNSRLDTMRYRKLASQGAISQQVLDTALSSEEQNSATVEAYRARLQQANDELQDTLIVAPISGRIDVNLMSVGSFVQAGQSVLATLSSVDPVVVKFSMSENEYLQFAKLGHGASPTEWGRDLKLVLSDGTEYALTGKIEQVDRGMTQDTGTLTMKASFANPQKILVPGMFARIVAKGEMRQGALLVPQRAVQELLGKTFITIVGEGDKAESRPVKMGPKIGNMWLVEEGLKSGDRVIVEGAAKVQPGMSLKVVMVGPDDIKTPAQ